MRTVYINPTNETVADFLSREGRQHDPPPRRLEEVPAGYHLVVLVENDLFDAAAVIVTRRDFEDFVLAPDDRYREYYIVETEKLEGVCPST